ncbi:unnamed protein product [Blepharisma stoltei]|uniref:Uncharacterized protein n=1 Tax=Blepharisma stoltei TaxID=1481888 RepID=A0AAU9K2X4_9CILI|nr:unnamed protein product [Blepharisma stoltei]
MKGGVYYNNSVFLFGGNSSGADMDLAMKFNLNQNRWVKIPKLISPSDSCSYALFKDSIFICGLNHTKLYKYDLNIDSYSGIDIAGVGRQIKKTLVYADSNLYMIDYNVHWSLSGCIDWAKNTWAHYGYLLLPFFEYSFVKFSKGSIFLWLTNKSYRTCYAFNIEKRKLEEFSKIEYL